VKLRGDGLQSRAEVFALPSFVHAGLPASERSTVLLATGMQAGESGVESEAVADES
jgi:hypothetical protein